MFEKKTDKVKHETKPRDDGVELENQFILQIPDEPAKTLHEALQTGNLKDRLSIKMESDLRYGEVRFDHWHLHAKIVDLPTVIECLKTIDNKSFYKSADICQLMICKEEPDAPEIEKESPNKGKKKDPNKVDKKYLWPHGITPPCKNIRKRRFRKTLKKKNVEAPEIEKEVKRLFRIDNDAVNVRYEIINEDEDEMAISQQTKDDIEDNDETLNDDKQLNDSNSNKGDINIESDAEEDLTSSMAHHGHGVGEHDIFGEEVSSSDDDEDRRHVSSRLRDIEDTSRLSADDSHLSDFSVGGGGGGGLNISKDVVTEFNKSMFSSSPKGGDGIDDGDGLKFGGSNSNLATSSSYYDETKRNDMEDDYSNDVPQMSNEQIVAKITELRRQYEDLKIQQALKAQEISSIQNPTLKQRMQETLDTLLSQMLEKEMEIKTYENLYG